MEIENDPHERARKLKEAMATVEHDPTNPTWRYRMKGGRIESKVFPEAKIPPGWLDSPAKCTEEPEPIEVAAVEPIETEPAEESPEPAKRRPGRPRKVKNGNGA